MVTQIDYDHNWLDLLSHNPKPKIYDDRTQDGLWHSSDLEDLQDNALIDSQLLP